MLKNKGYIGLFTLTVFMMLCAQAASATLEERVKEYTLKNGLKLLIVERHTSPTFSAYIRFKVGAVDEITGNTGIAHMLEHMLFKGTKTIGTTDFSKEKPVLDQIDRIGALIDRERKKAGRDEKRLKELTLKLKKLQQTQRKWITSEESSKIYAVNGGVGYNAFTSMDTTTYVISLPSNKLELWAAIESDRMREPVLREFYAERDVVKEERRRSIETRPWGKLYEQFIASAFNAHPYGRPVIGWMSDIKYLSKEATEKFLKRYYSPNNAVIAIVGDVYYEDVVSIMKRYFEGIEPYNLPLPLMTEEPEQKGERRIEVVWDAEPNLLIGYHKPTLPHADDDIFDVIDSILTNGRTSRLYKTIVEEKQMATMISTFGAPGARYPNLFCISSSPRYPHTTKDVELAIYDELDRLKTEPVSQRELNKVKNQIDADLIRSLKSNAGLAGRLSSFEVLAGSWRYILQNRERIKKVTPEDIMRVAKKYFVKENRTVGILVKKRGHARKGS